MCITDVLYAETDQVCVCVSVTPLVSLSRLTYVRYALTGRLKVLLAGIIEIRRTTDDHLSTTRSVVCAVLEICHLEIVSDWGELDLTQNCIYSRNSKR
jgi:hypothetical protein